jgi:nitrilase
MKIALGQTIGIAGNAGANLQLMQQMADKAAAQGADLLLLPELFLTGYNIGPQVRQLAEPCDGPSAHEAGAIAARAGLAIIYGYPEREAGAVYNAARMLDKSGKPLANYRKTHLWGRFEHEQFQAGSRASLFDFAGIRFGMMICYDIDFPEFGRHYSLKGAEAILALSATTAPYPVVPRKLVPARAYENRLFVLYCDRAGAEHGLRYAGESCIAAPDGEILAVCGQDEELKVAEVAFDRYRQLQQDRCHLEDRRLDLYEI